MPDLPCIEPPQGPSINNGEGEGGATEQVGGGGGGRGYKTGGGGGGGYKSGWGRGWASIVLHLHQRGLAMLKGVAKSFEVVLTWMPEASVSHTEWGRKKFQPLRIDNSGWPRPSSIPYGPQLGMVLGRPMCKIVISTDHNKGCWKAMYQIEFVSIWWYMPQCRIIYIILSL